MKKINNIVFISLFLMGISSCSNDKLPVYEDVSRVYFAWQTADPRTESPDDFVKINLGYDNPIKADSTISIDVRMMGPILDTDRPINAAVIRAESSAATGTDIEILPSVIPAGKEKGKLLVKIINTEKLSTTTLMARIRLLPNESFHIDYPAVGLEYNIYFDAKMDMPSLWADPMSGRILTSYFGKYSNEKFRLICEVCGLTRDFFMHDSATEDAYTVALARIPTPVSYGIIAQVNRYLDAYKTEHGEPMKDEYGDEIKMGISIK